MKPERLVTVHNPRYEVVVFMQADGGAEVMIATTTKFGKTDPQPTRLRLAPPQEGRRIAVQRNSDGSVEVEYRDA